MINIGEVERMRFADTGIRVSKKIGVNGKADPNDPIRYLGISRGNDGADSRPGVYMMLAKQGNGDTFDIIYIGKAGKGVNKRFIEHEAGYKRGIRNGKIAPGINKMIDKFSGLQVDIFEVWYRESELTNYHDHFGSNQDSLDWSSTYSLEEEILITKYRQYGLINAQMPPNIQISAPAFKHLNESYENAKQNSKELMFEEFNQSYGSWSIEVRMAVDSIIHEITSNIKSLNLKPKVSKYSDGPFRNQPVLIFGELARENFKVGTKKYMLTEDGRYFVENPFDIDKINILETLEYFDLP